VDEYDLIETPENVELQRRLAGIGTRFSAGVLDSILLFLIYCVFIVTVMIVLPFRPLDLIESPGANAWALAVLILVGFAIYWGYFAFFEWVMNGQTPGKRVMEIRVVKEGGGPIGFPEIAIRNLLRAVDGLGFYVVAGISMFVTKKVQRLGDLSAGTTVISEEQRDYRANTDRRSSIQWDSEVDTTLLRASGLSANEYRVLSNYWVRREQLSLDARRQLLPRLVGPILQRTGRTVANDSLEVLEEQVHRWLAGVPTASPVVQGPFDEQETTR